MKTHPPIAYKALKETKMILAGLLSQPVLGGALLSLVLFVPKITYLFPYNLIIGGAIYVFSLAAVLSGLFKHYPFSLWDIFKYSWRADPLNDQYYFANYEQSAVRRMSVLMILSLLMSLVSLGGVCFYSFYAFNQFFSLLETLPVYLPWVFVAAIAVYTVLSGIMSYCVVDYFFKVYEPDLYCGKKAEEERAQEKKMAFMIKPLSRKRLTPKDLQAKTDTLCEAIETLKTLKTADLYKVFGLSSLGRVRKERLLWNIAQLCPKKIWAYPNMLLLFSKRSAEIVKKVHHLLVEGDSQAQALQDYVQAANGRLEVLLALHHEMFLCYYALFEGNERTEMKAQLFNKILGCPNHFSDKSLDGFDHQRYMEIMDNHPLNELYTAGQQDKIFDNILSIPITTVEVLHQIEKIFEPFFKDQAERQKRFMNRLIRLDPQIFQKPHYASYEILLRLYQQLGQPDFYTVEEKDEIFKQILSRPIKSKICLGRTSEIFDTYFKGQAEKQKPFIEKLMRLDPQAFKKPDEVKRLIVDLLIRQLNQLSDGYTDQEQDEIFEAMLSNSVTTLSGLHQISEIFEHDFKGRAKRQRQFIEKLIELDLEAFQDKNPAAIKILRILTNYYNENYNHEYNATLTLYDEARIERILHWCHHTPGWKQMAKELGPLIEDAKAPWVTFVNHTVNGQTRREFEAGLESLLNELNQFYHKHQDKAASDEDKDRKEALRKTLEQRQAELFERVWGHPQKALQSLTRLTSVKPCEKDSFIFSLKRNFKDYCIRQAQENVFKQKILFHSEFNRLFASQSYENLLVVLEYLASDEALQSQFIRQHLLSCVINHQWFLLDMLKAGSEYSTAIINAVQCKDKKEFFLNNTFYSYDYEGIDLETLSSTLPFKFLKDTHYCTSYPDEDLKNSVITYREHEPGKWFIQDPNTVPMRLFQKIKRRTVDYRNFLKGVLWVSNLKKLLYFIKHGFQFQYAKNLWKKFLNEKCAWKISYLKRLTRGQLSIVHCYLTVGNEEVNQEIITAAQLYDEGSNYYKTYGQNNQTMKEIERFGRYVYHKSDLVNDLEPEEDKVVCKDISLT